MPDAEDGDVKERLRQALWLAVGKMVDEESMNRDCNATPSFIGALTQLVHDQIESVATDLENFSRHAGRTTVTTDDVLLLARRNPDLYDMIKDGVDRLQASKTQAKSKSKR